MNKSESIFKWGIAIFIIFGLLTLFFIFQWGVVLKISLIVLSIVLIATILIQSGRGGGLAAIGGLSDQSMMGTKTGSFLGNVTYLLGAAVFVSIIFLSKTNISTRMRLETPMSNMATPPAAQQTHDDHNHGQSSQPVQGGMSEVEPPIGMKEVQDANTSGMGEAKTGESGTLEHETGENTSGPENTTTENK